MTITFELFSVYNICCITLLVKVWQTTKLSSIPQHCTVVLYTCTPHCTVRVSAWAGVKYQANNTIRPPTFTTRCLLQFFYCLPPQIQGFYCSFYKGHGVLWKIWQNIYKPARTLFMEIEWRVKNCRYERSDMKRKTVSDIKLCWWTFNYIDRWQK